jgi:arylformamidase
LSRIHDITPTISARIAVWPGDVGFSRQEVLSIDAGDNIDLSAIHTTVHLGAHTDAPSHYVQGGEGISERDLEIYFGPCQVITASTVRGQSVVPGDLQVAIQAPRVLFRTESFPDPEVFNEDFTSLSAVLIDSLAEQGVRLVGIDTPSIDPFSSKDLPGHAAIARHDMAILEGVVLTGVPDGVYTLVALPLKLEGADASPVRAVLIEET